MLAPNTLIDAQHRRQDTGERAPPPQSHWRRAWARTQPTLDDKTERRLLHAGLQFQNAMKVRRQARGRARGAGGRAAHGLGHRALADPPGAPLVVRPACRGGARATLCSRA
jgi:hypothetical protein